MNKLSSDYLVIGGGIIGSCIAKSLAIKFPTKSIILLEKDNRLGMNNSTLNSGVIHSGLYYPINSKRSFYCIRGNKLLSKFHKDRNLNLKECGKLIVPNNENEIEKTYNLYNQGKQNGIDLELFTADQAINFEPNLRINGNYPVIFSPNTYVGDPKGVIKEIEKDIYELRNIKVITNSAYHKILYLDKSVLSVLTKDNKIIETGFLINSSGLYSDKIAKDFDSAKELTMIPLMGTYLLDRNKSDNDFKTLIYPIPSINGNNFLGVHTNFTSEGLFKLGPTALPCLWREQHKGINSFNINEFIEIVNIYLKIIFSNKSKYFVSLLLNEMKKYNYINIIKEGKKIIKSYDNLQFNIFDYLSNIRFNYKTGGIRTQLLDINNYELLNDFVFIKNSNNLHFLNMISPGWTSALAIADDIDLLI